MLDTLQRPRLDVAAAVKSASPPRPTARLQTDRGREWGPTPVQLRVVVPQPASTPETPPPAMVEREPKTTSRGRRILALLVLNTIVLTSLAVFVGLALGPRTGHYRTLTMLTGSMRPEFPTGSVVVVTPERTADLRPGHVITFHAPIEDRRVVTHRIVSIDRSGPYPVVVTKGDANVGDDPWKAVLDDPYVWRARFAVPYIGQGISLLRQPAVQLVATRVLPGMLLLWLVISIWRTDSADA